MSCNLEVRIWSYHWDFPYPFITSSFYPFRLVCLICIPEKNVINVNVAGKPWSPAVCWEAQYREKHPASNDRCCRTTKHGTLNISWIALTISTCNNSILSMNSIPLKGNGMRWFQLGRKRVALVWLKRGNNRTRDSRSFIIKVEKSAELGVRRWPVRAYCSTIPRLGTDLRSIEALFQEKEREKVDHGTARDRANEHACSSRLDPNKGVCFPSLWIV